MASTMNSTGEAVFGFYFGSFWFTIYRHLRISCLKDNLHKEVLLGMIGLDACNNNSNVC